jgi:tRNA modification GTPase
MAPIEETFKLICRVSALDRTGLDTLDGIVKKMFEDETSTHTGEFITNERQADAVAKALKSTELAIESLGSGLTPDAVLIDVESALSAIGELNGKSIREDITSRIFERFCVGK